MLAATIALATSGPPALADRIELALGAGGADSSWRDDRVAFSTVAGGYRFGEHLSADLVARLGRGQVDDRYVAEISPGATGHLRLGPTSPHLRLALLHTHEQPPVSLEHDRLGSAFGVADGIRHRYGALVGVGVAVPFARGASTEWSLGADLTLSSYLDDRGPARYWFAGVALGFAFLR